MTMRFTLAVLLATIGWPDRVDSQSFYVGMRAGQASSRQYSRFGGCADGFCFPESPANRSLRRGPNVASGLAATWEFAPWLALESELLLVEKGMRESFGDELRIGYLELPVLLRVAMPISTRGVNVFVHGGPAPAHETSCTAHSSLGVGLNVPIDCNVFRETKTDFGWVTGGGALLRRPAYQITVSWRRTMGARDLQSDNPTVARINDTRSFLIGLATRVR